MMALSLVFRRLILRLGVTAAFVACLTLTGRAVLPAGNVVQQWNTIAENTVVGSGVFQNEGLIYMAYVSAAVYDAVAAIEGGYEPYGPPIDAPAGASVEAAVVEAAYRTLRYYFPAQAAALDALYAEALAAIPDGLAKQNGLEVGLAAASQIIALRTGDGRLTPIGTTSPVQFPEPGPGVWRRTPPYAAPQTPWVGSVEPFVLHNVQQFHPAPPPPLKSRRWVVQFEEVKEYGRATDSLRTTEQTAIARFWTANVIRQYNLLGRDIATNESLTLIETARLLAMINIVGADAQIALMHWKYEFLFWRPVTAIDPTSVTADHFSEVPGFDDGNPATVEEIGWRPLVVTPNHPEYPGAHGSITGAIAEVLTEFFGSKQINITIHGFDPAGAAGNLAATRYFATADQLLEEIVNARVWSGIHYRSATEAGVKLGQKVAHFDLRHAFKPEH
jgi:PAP2 superfamily